VLHQPYKGVKLSEKGREIELQAIRRQVIVERMLTEILKIELIEAHKIADEIEHYIPDNTIKRIEQILERRKKSFRHVNNKKYLESPQSQRILGNL